MEKPMKKFSIFFILFTISLIVNNIYKPEIKVSLGNGYSYFDAGFDCWQSISKDGDEIIPVKVVEYKYDNRYIIAVRVVVELYKCYKQNVTIKTAKNIVAFPVVPKHQLQYWFIDKSRKIAYFSMHKEKINKIIKKNASKLAFSNHDYLQDIYMRLKTSDPNNEFECKLTNSPLQNNKSIHIIDMDN
jgi:hypothetical protein